MKNVQKNIMVLSSLLLFALGCGSVPQNASEMTTEEKAQAESEKAANAGLSNPSDYFSVEGYVSPISISVDGKSYKDSEDFYTQELRRLQVEVKKQYPDYSLSFDANVGLKNFKTGMYVFLVATNDVGVASEAYVNGTGKFIFTLESDVDRTAEYTLRATKRIGLTLSKKGASPITWCYNMYAEKNVVLDGKSNVLRSFTTAVTEYECSDSNESGISLPDSDGSEMDALWSKRSAAESKRIQELNQTIEEKSQPAPTPSPVAAKEGNDE